MATSRPVLTETLPIPPLDLTGRAPPRLVVHWSRWSTAGQPACRVSYSHGFMWSKGNRRSLTNRGNVA